MAEFVLQLSEEAAAFVHDRVEAGAAATPSDVVEQAVEQLRQREVLRQRKLDRLNAAIQDGEDAIADGAYEDVPFDQIKTWMEQLRPGHSG